MRLNNPALVDHPMKCPSLQV